MLANRAPSISLTESDGGTPKRGRAGYEEAHTGPNRKEGFGEGSQNGSPEAK